ncbi:aminodeoxychorismate lyase [Actinoplanes sp. TBRC 11911]|uniref:aminotransferase class IV n=1 Tax=Actinoplanes sp. TBRC 11911 TaxID=2729386 RepID=UPI00145E9093|nr:aminotransferase class IV [Actinoplanes sp. TBRC 11911]NMO55754.1 aminodeoxychorismate lyase [Actinoplanes sp. TBRC 11911]
MVHVEINGAPAEGDLLHRVATSSYGHFTSMQVRDRAVAGLDRHVRRLREASAELFPDTPAAGDATITKLIGQALRDHRDASVRVTILGTDVMVEAGEPVPDDPKPPLKVRTVTYERELPHLKHLATMGLIYHRRRAARAGYDDVLFAGRDGHLREGSIWNLAFWDGERVIWPSAPMLAGITMQLLRQGLDNRSIPQIDQEITDMSGMRGAALTNSQCPAQPIASIDATTLDDHAALTSLLRQAWQTIPWQPI